MEKGQVNDIKSREVNTSRGPGAAYDMIVEGKKYSYGFKKPACNVGDTIEFTAAPNGAYGDKITYFKVVEGGASAPMAAPAKAAGSTSGYSNKVFPIPPLHPDRAIVRQNSLTNARELFVSQGPLRDGENLEDAATTIIAIARIFESYSTGDLDLASAEAAIDKEFN